MNVLCFLVKISSRSTFSLSLSLSLSKFVSLSKKTFRASFLCGPFVLLLFAAFSCCLLFVCLLSSSFLPPQKRESIIYLHLSNDDDAFLFCEDSPNGGGREHQEGTLLFLSFQILSLRFWCRRLRRRLSRLHDHRFFVSGRYFLDRTRALLEPSREESERSSSSSLRRSSLNPVVLFFARERERERESAFERRRRRRRARMHFD